MGYQQDIENRYRKSYEASKSTLDAGNKAKLADLQNQELDVKNKYSQLLDTFNKRPEETHCSISCGRSKVIGLKHCDEIEILVIDNYMSATVFLDE